MRSFAIGALPLIDNAEPIPGIILQTPIEGLESINQRNTAVSRPGQHGAIMSSQFYDTRLIKLTGVIWGNTPAEYEANRRLLSTALAMKKDTTGYPAPIRITFTTLAGSSYFVDVFFNAPIFSFDRPNATRFFITATAVNPFIYGATQVTSGNIMPPSGGGYVVPMIVPYTSSGAAGGDVIMFNSGEEKAKPVIMLYGSLTSPIISNMTTGRSLQLDYTLQAGDTAKIDMDLQSITLNNSSSLMAYKTDVSDWWGIEPGNNTVALTTNSTADTGHAVIGFYPPHVGV